MVYASLACISVAMMSPIESFANIKGERFRFHLQTPEVRNRKFSLSYFTEINIKGRSWSPSNCPFGELGKTWEATKYKWPEKNYVCRKQARPSPATFRPGPFLGTEFHGPTRTLARPVQTSVRHCRPPWYEHVIWQYNCIKRSFTLLLSIFLQLICSWYAHCITSSLSLSLSACVRLNWIKSLKCVPIMHKHHTWYLLSASLCQVIERINLQCCFHNWLIEWLIDYLTGQCKA